MRDVCIAETDGDSLYEIVTLKPRPTVEEFEQAVRILYERSGADAVICSIALRNLSNELCEEEDCSEGMPDGGQAT